MQESDRTNPDTSTMETEQGLKSDSDIIKMFKQFMEQSSLGEYHARLDMLLSFHCHLVTMETSPKQGKHDHLNEQW